MPYSELYSEKKQTKPLKNLNTLRLENVCVDVTLSIGDRHFPAHKIVLISMSDFFKAMFTSDFQEKNSPIVTIGEEFVNSEVFGDIIEYVYTGSITITESNVFNLCCASHYLKLENLLNATLRFLTKNLNRDNFKETYWISIKYDFNELFIYCLHYINFNPNVTENNFFVNLENDDFSFFLKNFLKYSIFKEDVFSVFSKWLNKDFFNRSKLLVSLLNGVPSELVNRKMLEDFLVKMKIDYRADSSLEKYIQTIPPEITESLYLLSYSKVAILPSFNKVFNFKTIYSKPTYSFENDLNHFQIIDATHIFDKIKRKSFSLPQGMLFPNGAFCIHKGFIYSVGGSVNGKPDNRAKRYDSRGSMESLSPMKKARRDFELIGCGDYLYAIGGLDSQKSVEKYDPANDKWTKVAPTFGRHLETISVVKNEKIFVLSNNYFEVYFPNENIWKILPSVDDSVYWNKLGYFDGKFYAFSWTYSPSYNTGCRLKIKIFEPTTKIWTNFDDFDFEREQVEGLCTLKNII